MSGCTSHTFASFSRTWQYHLLKSNMHQCREQLQQLQTATKPCLLGTLGCTPARLYMTTEKLWSDCERASPSLQFTKCASKYRTTFSLALISNPINFSHEQSQPRYIQYHLACFTKHGLTKFNCTANSKVEFANVSKLQGH